MKRFPCSDIITALDTFPKHEGGGNECRKFRVRGISDDNPEDYCDDNDDDDDAAADGGVTVVKR